MRPKCGLYLVVLSVFAWGAISGCGKSSEEPQYDRVRGKVSSIHTDTGVVEMLWFSKKRGKEISLKGKLAPGAEILINGRTATLDEILVGDDVTVTGRSVKRDGDRELVATHVEVKRPESPTSGAATQPAATAPAGEGVK